MTYLDQRAGDGHELLTSTMSLMTNHILGRSKVNYTDYTPLATLFSEPMTLVVRPDSPLKIARDIQDRLQNDPRSLSIAIGIAVGATNHLALALVMKSMGIDVKKLKTVVVQIERRDHDGADGRARRPRAVVGGDGDGSRQQGKLRIIGVSSETARRRCRWRRSPTWKEQGFDVVFTNTRFAGRAEGLSAAQMAYWDAVLERMIQSEEWKSEAQKDSLEMDYHSSRQSPQRLAAMYKQLKDALIDAGLAKE